MYTLIIWTIGCIGLNCSTPDYELQYFDTEEKCKKVLVIWKSINEKNSGACVPGRIK